MRFFGGGKIQNTYDGNMAGRSIRLSLRPYDRGMGLANLPARPKFAQRPTRACSSRAAVRFRPSACVGFSSIFRTMQERGWWGPLFLSDTRLARPRDMDLPADSSKCPVVRGLHRKLRAPVPLRKASPAILLVRRKEPRPKIRDCAFGRCVCLFWFSCHSVYLFSLFLMLKCSRVVEVGGAIGMALFIAPIPGRAPSTSKKLRGWDSRRAALLQSRGTPRNVFVVSR